MQLRLSQYLVFVAATIIGLVSVSCSSSKGVPEEWMRAGENKEEFISIHYTSWRGDEDPILLPREARLNQAVFYGVQLNRLSGGRPIAGSDGFRWLDVTLIRECEELGKRVLKRNGQWIVQYGSEIRMQDGDYLIFKERRDRR